VGGVKMVESSDINMIQKIMIINDFVGMIFFCP
jgi:hypothetical protein